MSFIIQSITHDVSENDSIQEELIHASALNDKKTTISSTQNSYQPTLNIGMDVTSRAIDDLSKIKDKDIRQQTGLILETIQTYIVLLCNKHSISKRLPMILMNVRDDQTVLLEWNFRNFRIGFEIEHDQKNTIYFFVSEDISTGAYSAESKPLGENYNDRILWLVDYVLENS